MGSGPHLTIAIVASTKSHESVLVSRIRALFPEADTQVRTPTPSAPLIVDVLAANILCRSGNRDAVCNRAVIIDTAKRLATLHPELEQCPRVDVEDDKRIRRAVRDLIAPSSPKGDGSTTPVGDDAEQSAPLQRVLADVSDSRWQTILRCSPLGIALVRQADGAIIDCNPQMGEMVAREPDSLTGQTLVELKACTPREFMAVRRAIMRGRPMRNIERVICRADGEKIETLSSLEPLDLDNEACMLIMTSDVTEIRRIEREFLREREAEEIEVGQTLHEGIGQQLSGIAMLAASLREELVTSKHRSAEVARLIAEFATDAVEKTRRLSRRLSPLADPTFPLVAALTDLTERLRHVHGVRCEFAWHSLDVPRDMDVQTQLYRIVQASVTAALRQSQRPSSIRVRLRADRDAVSLLVEDDLADPYGDRSEGLAARIVYHRARLIGATLTFEPLETRGLRMHVVWNREDAENVREVSADLLRLMNN